MNVLAIETATRAATVAVASGPRTLQETVGQPTTAMLVPAIHGLLDSLGLSVKQLHAVAVDIGPGSFTGLRVGIAFAKTLAFAAEIPLVTVSSLELIASQAAGSLREAGDTRGDRLMALMDAQRGQFFAAGFQRQDPSQSGDGVSSSGVCGLFAAEIYEAEQIAKRIADGWIWAGPTSRRLEQAAAAGRWNDQLRTVVAPEARHLADLAVRRAAIGDTDPLSAAQPMYLRPSAAEEKAASA